MNTAGHLLYFRNFEVEPKSNGATSEDNLEFSFNNGQKKYQIVPKNNGQDALPFWIMRVPKEIVPNHSDIFTEAFENMLSSLLQWTATSVEPTKLKCDRYEQPPDQGVATDYINKIEHLMDSGTD